MKFTNIKKLGWFQGYSEKIKFFGKNLIRFLEFDDLFNNLFHFLFTICYIVKTAEAV